MDLSFRFRKDPKRGLIFSIIRDRAWILFEGTAADIYDFITLRKLESKTPEERNNWENLFTAINNKRWTVLRNG